jgi:predicted dehydrogenase
MGQMRAALVGTGFISTKKHIPAFRRIGDRVRLTAVVDVNESAAHDVAARFDIPRAYVDLEQMLDQERPDLVDVCTPPRTHAAIALRAIDHGCHVLIEKPMAVSMDECDGIIDAARRRGVKVCVAHSDLFYPPFIRARRQVARGTIGEFGGMRIFLSTPASYMTAREDHWAHRLPGGVIGESGPHVVYMTLAFINPIREVRVLGSKLLPYPWSRFDDYRIELVGDRATSSITAVYTSDQWAAEVDIWGSHGLLKLDLELMSLASQRRPGLGRWQVASSGIRASAAVAGHTLRAGAAALSGRYRNTHELLIEGFIRSIAEDRDPPVSAQEGREAVRVMGLVAEALETG